MRTTSLCLGLLLSASGGSAKKPAGLVFRTDSSATEVEIKYDGALGSGGVGTEARLTVPQHCRTTQCTANDAALDAAQ